MSRTSRRIRGEVLTQAARPPLSHIVRWRKATTVSATSVNSDTRHVTEYNDVMMRTFADNATRDLFVTGRSRQLPPDMLRRALRKLEYIDVAVRLDDLRVPPRNRLHGLGGDRPGQYEISVNDQWRICCRYTNGDAYDVEIPDYH